MALSIKSIPVLYGETAERFEAEAEQNAKRPTPRLTAERKSSLDAFLARSKAFVL